MLHLQLLYGKLVALCAFYHIECSEIVCLRVVLVRKPNPIQSICTILGSILLYSLRIIRFHRAVVVWWINDWRHGKARGLLIIPSHNVALLYEHSSQPVSVKAPVRFSQLFCTWFNAIRKCLATVRVTHTHTHPPFGVCTQTAGNLINTLLINVGEFDDKSIKAITAQLLCATRSNYGEHLKRFSVYAS